MKYFFVTGEYSGDLIAASVIRELYHADPRAQIAAWGGDQMKKTACQIYRDQSGMQVMGYSGIIRQLFAFRQLIKDCKRDITHFSPDVVILVDYGGFNMRLLSWLKKQGTKVAYLSPPKTWASRSSRNKALRSYSDLLIPLFAFEQRYFEGEGLSSKYWGHPLQPKKTANPSLKPIIGTIIVAPGSRMQEIHHILPTIIETARSIKTPYKWIISIAPNLDKDLITSTYPLPTSTTIEYSTSPLTELYEQGDLSIITSGTASIQAAWAGIPQIVVYRTSQINYLIAKSIIKVKYLSLVNLEMNKDIVPELIQQKMTVTHLTNAIEKLSPMEARQKSLSQYLNLQNLTFSNYSSFNIAKTIFDLSM